MEKKTDRWRKEGSGPRQVIMQSPAIVATNSTPAAAQSGPYVKNPPKISIAKFVKLTDYSYAYNNLTNYQFKVIYIMAGYGNYANLSKKFCYHIEWTYSRRVLAIWNHCVPTPLHLPPPAATAQGQKFPQDDSIIGQALNLPIHFQSSGAQIVVVAVASLPPHRPPERHAKLPPPVCRRTTALKNLLKNRSSFLFFPWICSNSFNISLSTTRTLWIVYGGFTRPPGGGGLTWL